MAADRPPLIAHVIHRLDFGGLENGLVNLVNGLPADRYRHAIVCLAGFNPEFRARIRDPRIGVVSLQKRQGKDIGVYRRMWSALRSLAPTIVHTRNLGTVDLQWVAWAAGVPCRVHGEHGWEAADPKGLDARGLRIRWLCRPVVHRYVPMSRDIGLWLEQHVGVDATQIRQLYSGVDTDRFRPPSGLPGRPADCERQMITIGTVGRLDPVKNQVALLEAVAGLLPGLPGLRLTIVGDGPLRRFLEEKAAALGLRDVVTFTGARSDTPDLMRGFDLFVLPSINEGISNTILEAMATGLAVVASDTGGNPEVVADGVTGRLYEASKPQALSQALLPYLTDPALRRAHGQAGRDRVVQNFSLDAMVQRYLDLYDELLSPPRWAGVGRLEGL
jgi:sugar transferase (PEP-CTERM/EpsH1 system associated)